MQIKKRSKQPSAKMGQVGPDIPSAKMGEMGALTAKDKAMVSGHPSAKMGAAEMGAVARLRAAKKAEAQAPRKIEVEVELGPTEAKEVPAREGYRERLKKRAK